MTLKEIEAQKNLIVACQERLSKAENDFEETQREKHTVEKKLQNILDNEESIKNEIYDLERVVVAEINAEELFNELNALDINRENVKNINPQFTTILENFRSREPLGILDENLMLKQKRKYTKQFDFKTIIRTKARIYELHSHFAANELINGKPVYEHLQVVNHASYIPLGTFVDFDFDEDFYKNFKVRLTLAQMKTYLNLETAVMNILKRHENAENV